MLTRTALTGGMTRLCAARSSAPLFMSGCPVRNLSGSQRFPYGSRPYQNPAVICRFTSADVSFRSRRQNGCDLMLRTATRSRSRRPKSPRRSLPLIAWLPVASGRLADDESAGIHRVGRALRGEGATWLPVRLVDDLRGDGPVSDALEP